jgi:hypothetical protein
MTEIFPIDDTRRQSSARCQFVLLFNAFPQAEALKNAPLTRR